MNKTVLFVAILVMFSCAEKKPKTNTKTKKVELNQNTEIQEQTTSIEFDTEMHDFGSVKSGEILTFSFVFTNRGESGLTINKAESDCGCIESTIPDKTTPPGEKGIIEVTLNSAGLIGKQLKIIEIQSNSKEPKHLIIFAEVENELFEIKN